MDQDASKESHESSGIPEVRQYSGRHERMKYFLTW